MSDLRHNFNFTAVAQTPQFENTITRRLASGWTVSSIYRFQSGTPLYIRSGLDNNLQGAGYLTNLQRPNQVLDDVYARTGNQWFNPAAFAQPALGTANGNVGVNSVVGPRHWQFDMAVSRGFRIRESQRFEVRLEAFNVLNKFQFGDPVPTGNAGTTLTSAMFGKMLTNTGARVGQVAVKYVF